MLLALTVVTVSIGCSTAAPPAEAPPRPDPCSEGGVLNENGPTYSTPGPHIIDISRTVTVPTTIGGREVEPGRVYIPAPDPPDPQESRFSPPRLVDWASEYSSPDAAQLYTCTEAVIAGGKPPITSPYEGGSAEYLTFPVERWKITIKETRTGRVVGRVAVDRSEPGAALPAFIDRTVSTTPSPDGAALYAALAPYALGPPR